LEPSSNIAPERPGWQRLLPSRGLSRFVAQRAGALVLLAIGIVVVSFVLTHLVPGNPALANLGQNPTPSEIRTFNQQNGLDKPLPVQLGIYFVHLLHGNLGTDEQTGEPVAKELGSAIPATAELSIVAIVISLVFGVGFGLLAALRRGGITDFLSRILSLIGVSVPTFWLALIALYLLFFKLGIFPGGSRLSPNDTTPPHVTGMYTVDALIAGRWSTFWDALKHLLLPAIVLAAWSMGILTRYTRTAVLEVMGQDYIRSARARGLSRRTIVFGHILRAALPSIVTVIGIVFANIMSGAVLVENIFSWPGIGEYAYQSSTTLDLPAIAGVSLFIAIVYVVVNFIVDILYGVLDPRVRVQ
jgi:peptide/nickel transport system permease protein